MRVRMLSAGAIGVVLAAISYVLTLVSNLPIDSGPGVGLGLVVAISASQAVGFSLSLFGFLALARSLGPSLRVMGILAVVLAVGSATNVVALTVDGLDLARPAGIIWAATHAAFCLAVTLGEPTLDETSRKLWMAIRALVVLPVFLYALYLLRNLGVMSLGRWGTYLPFINNVLMATALVLLGVLMLRHRHAANSAPASSGSTAPRVRRRRPARG